MATTTNYGWTTPDDTALVKDGAAAIRTLGSSVDTTTKNLNPSTTLGDIEYRSSTANTNTRLGIGSTGNVLTVAGGVPTWAAPAGGGKVLQVVQGTLTANFTNNTGTPTDTGLTVTITPSSATSKVLVHYYFGIQMLRSGANTDIYMFSELLQGATVVHQTQWGIQNFASSSGKQMDDSVGAVHLASPATTSATTYKIRMFNSASSTVRLTADTINIASIVAMEIGA
jgi:hypothetical protein